MSRPSCSISAILFSCLALPVTSGDDVYQISLKGQPNLCLDLYGGKADDGTAIDIWTCNPGVKGQQWYFDVGTFKLRSAVDPSKCIDAGSRNQGQALAINDCNIGMSQFWSWADKTSTIYLYSQVSGKTICMDVKDAVYKDGNPVQLWPCDGDANQAWTIGRPPKPFKMQVQGQNLCLDLSGQKTDNGTPVDVWKCTNGIKGQEWYFEPNSFKIQSAVDPTKCIDASNMQMRVGLRIWDCNDMPQQEWGYDQGKKTIFLGKDVKDESLCMCLTAFTNGAQIQLYTCTDQGSEQWVISAVDPSETAPLQLV